MHVISTEATHSPIVSGAVERPLYYVIVFLVARSCLPFCIPEGIPHKPISKKMG